MSGRPPVLPWRHYLYQRDIDAQYRLARSGTWKADLQERLAMHVLVPLIAVVVRARFRLTVDGRPPDGGCVLVSYHDNYWDGVVAGILDTRIKPVVNQQWMSKPVVGWFLRHARAIPTREHTVDRAAQLVEQGWIVWIAAGGFHVRTRGPYRPRSGTARIALATNRPVVPMTFAGLNRAGVALWRRRRVHVAIGAPIHPGPDENVEAFTERYFEVLMKQQYEPAATTGADDNASTVRP